MKRLFVVLSAAALIATVAALGASAQTQARPTIVDQWQSVQVPPPPVLSAVTVDPATTALLILDMQSNLVNAATRPRAAATIPDIRLLLDGARAHRLLVVYSNAGNAGPGDIAPDLAPLAGDPVVKSGVDKFFHTDLEQILASHGIKTVIVTGTAANGAVLSTATGAALRGLKVIVPVDGMSADPPFVELYTAYHLVNSPGTRNATTLTRANEISFGM